MLTRANCWQYQMEQRTITRGLSYLWDVGMFDRINEGQKLRQIVQDIG